MGKDMQCSPPNYGTVYGTSGAPTKTGWNETETIFLGYKLKKSQVIREVLLLNTQEEYQERISGAVVVLGTSTSDMSKNTAISG